MIEIEIDGQKIQAEPGSMIIEAADKVGIKIPRFCYHKKLSIAANCRMCLVAVEKSRKPLPACATPITDGMVVNTQTAEAIAAQKAVMEFLLINHPLDCPICDQGGECELQDIAMGYGKDVSRFSEGKRVVKDKNLGSLIATDMTRCILCTRCIRFGEEVAGIAELGMTYRGEASEVGTYVEEHLISEVSGNIIDLCPVGALTSKPFRFKARPWELTQHTSIAPHDPLGANIYIHTRRDEVMRVVPKECEAINETWASDRDRFSYTGLRSGDRLLKPMIKAHNQWQECTWDMALRVANERLEAVRQKQGSDAIAAIVSPNLSCEELYLAQKYIRGLGSSLIEHRLQQVDAALIPSALLPADKKAKIAEVEAMDAIFLVGCDIQREIPLLGLRVRKASLQGARIMSLNPVDFTFNFVQTAQCVVQSQAFVLALALWIQSELSQDEAKNWPLLATLATNDPDYCGSADYRAYIHQHMLAIKDAFAQGGNKLIVMGALAVNDPQASLIQQALLWLAERYDAKFMMLAAGANHYGAVLAEAMPAQQKSIVDLWQAKLPGYLLVNVEPELDCTHPALALKALQDAYCVVVMSAFTNEKMLEYADVLLPIAPFSEYAGTFVNLEGLSQSFNAATHPKGEARPAWKVLRVLAQLAQLPHFDYENWTEISKDIKTEVQAVPLMPLAQQYRLPQLQAGLRILPYWPLYNSDALVRRAEPLQRCALSSDALVVLHPQTAVQYGLKEGDTVALEQQGQVATLRIKIDAKVVPQTLYWPMGFSETACWWSCESLVLNALTPMEVN